ncbi:hypothetical protein JCM5353_001139 [Sporobolomyces roseus]
MIKYLPLRQEYRFPEPEFSVGPFVDTRANGWRTCGDGSCYIHTNSNLALRYGKGSVRGEWHECPSYDRDGWIRILQWYLDNQDERWIMDVQLDSRTKYNVYDGDRQDALVQEQLEKMRVVRTWRRIRPGEISQQQEGVLEGTITQVDYRDYLIDDDVPGYDVEGTQILLDATFHQAPRIVFRYLRQKDGSSEYWAQVFLPDKAVPPELLAPTEASRYPGRPSVLFVNDVHYSSFPGGNEMPDFALFLGKRFSFTQQQLSSIDYNEMEWELGMIPQAGAGLMRNLRVEDLKVEEVDESGSVVGIVNWKGMMEVRNAAAREATRREEERKEAKMQRQIEVNLEDAQRETDEHMKALREEKEKGVALDGIPGDQTSSTRFRPAASSYSHPDSHVVSSDQPDAESMRLAKEWGGEDEVAWQLLEAEKRRELDHLDQSNRDESAEEGTDMQDPNKSEDEDMAFANDSFQRDLYKDQTFPSLSAATPADPNQAVSNTSTQAFTVPLPPRPAVLPKVKHRGSLRNPSSVKVERKGKGKAKAKGRGDGEEEMGEGELIGTGATTWKGQRAREVLKSLGSYEECKNSRLVDAVGICLRWMEMNPVLASDNEAEKARLWREIWWLKDVIRFLISAKEVIKTTKQLKPVVDRLPSRAQGGWPWNVKEMLLEGEALRHARRIDGDGKFAKLQKVAALPGIPRFAIPEMRLNHGVVDVASFFKSSKVEEAQRIWKDNPTEEFVTRERAIELGKMISKSMDAELEGLGPLALLVGSLGSGRIDSHNLDILLSWVGGDVWQITNLLMTLDSKGILDTVYSFSTPSQMRDEPEGKTFGLYKSCHFAQVGLKIDGQRYLADLFFCINGKWIVANLLLRSSESVVRALQEVALDCGYVLTLEGLFTRAAWLANGRPIKIDSEEEVFDRLRLKWIPSTSRRADAAKDGRRYEGGI